MAGILLMVWRDVRAEYADHRVSSESGAGFGSEGCVRLRFGSGRRCEGSAVLCRFAVLETGVVIVPVLSSDARLESCAQLVVE